VASTIKVDSIQTDTGNIAFSTVASERLRIDNNGNVGIGTSSPSSYGLLTVLSSTAGSAKISIQDTSGGASPAPLVQFGVNSSNGFNTADAARIWTTSPSSTTAALNFAAYSGGAPSTAQMTLTGGNVGIGTSSPSTYGKFAVVSSTAGAAKISIQDTSGGSASPLLQFGMNDSSGFNTSDASRIWTTAASSTVASLNFAAYNGSPPSTAQMTLTGGNLQFNSGYGSVATAYGCRAWANFSGVGSVTVRGSGGVTSIAYTAAGKYTVSLSTTLTDLNYSLVLGCCGLGSGTGGKILVEDTGASSALSRTSSSFVLINSYSFVNPGAGETNNSISSNFAVFR